VKTFSRKIVRHLLAYLTVHKLMEYLVLNVNFVCKVHLCAHQCFKEI